MNFFIKNDTLSDRELVLALTLPAIGIVCCCTIFIFLSLFIKALLESNSYHEELDQYLAERYGVSFSDNIN